MAIISWKKVQEALEVSDKLRKLAKDYPNDQKLGEEIRKLVNLKK